MRNGTSTAPAKCIGYVIHNSEDGPEALACMDDCCTKPEADTHVRTYADGYVSTPETRAKAWSRIPEAPSDEPW